MAHVTSLSSSEHGFQILWAFSASTLILMCGEMLLRIQPSVYALVYHVKVFPWSYRIYKM